MNILIITYVFPPVNVIGAQRPYSWAKYWSRAGHTICVLTARPEAFDGPLDSDFDKHVFSSINVVSVKYWPLSKSSSQSEPPTNMLPTSSHRQSGALIRQAKKMAKGIRQKLGMGALLSVRNLWVRPAVEVGIKLHQEAPFDLIVSTYGPPASHIVASRLKQKIGSPWVADYRDLWFGAHYLGAEGIFAPLQKYTETRTVAGADMFTTVSDPLRDQLAGRFQQPCFTIENGFDLEESPASLLDDRSGDDKPDHGKIRLVYTGSIRSGQQTVIPFFQALQSLRHQTPELDQQLEVVIYGLRLGEVPALVSQLQLDPVVKLAGFLNRKDSLKAQRQADALLFFDWKDTSVDGILTGKIFEYLFAGKPILGIGSIPQTAPGKLLLESGTGVCLGTNAQDIARLLNQLLLKKAVPYDPNRDVLRRYSRESLAHKMLSTIASELFS